MINGVMHIVAAVLFAVVSVHEGVNPIWMGIAGVYLVMGIINLSIHALKMRKMERAAKKAEQENRKKSDETAEKEEAEVAAGG